MMAMLAAIRKRPVSNTVNPVPGIKEVSIPVKKSTIKK
jgi:hypothetical protein